MELGFAEGKSLLKMGLSVTIGGRLAVWDVQIHLDTILKPIGRDLFKINQVQ
jgi:hypothetical protein